MSFFNYDYLVSSYLEGMHAQGEILHQRNDFFSWIILYNPIHSGMKSNPVEVVGNGTKYLL